MKNNIAKCGCDCKNCPTYKENIITDEDRLNCSKGWNKYLNIKLSPEKIRKCNGCSIPNNERKVYYLNCKVRKCAMVNEIKNCAYCTGFPCYELLEAHSLQKIQSAEEFISTSGKEISEEDFNLYIEPYLGLKHLNDIRQTLLKKEIIDFKKFLVKNKFASFSASKDYPKELEIIYNLLKNICNENNISYSKLQTLQHKRKQLLKLLWIFILYGDYNNNSKILSISSKSFLKHKITAMYETLIMYFNDLKKKQYLL